MSEREGINENKKKFFLLTRKYIVKKVYSMLCLQLAVGKYTVYECSEAQTELAIVDTKVLNISHSIIHSFEPSTV